MVLASLPAVFTFGLLLRKAVRSGLRVFRAFHRCSNRYVLRLAGHQSLAPCFAGWDRLGIAVYGLLLIVYSLQLISWLFADNLQISCGFLGGFVEKA